MQLITYPIATAPSLPTGALQTDAAALPSMHVLTTTPSLPTGAPASDHLSVHQPPQQQQWQLGAAPDQAAPTEIAAASTVKELRIARGTGRRQQRSSSYSTRARHHERRAPSAQAPYRWLSRHCETTWHAPPCYRCVIALDCSGLHAKLHGTPRRATGA